MPKRATDERASQNRGLMGSISLPWPFKKRGTVVKEERHLEELGVTPQLRDLVKGFTVATFKDFPLQDDPPDTKGDASSMENVRKDLSEWQEQHATLVLSQVKEISQLRYVLCPRHLKEKQFWRIYFLLVKSCVAPFEIRAIQKAKVMRMGSENEILAEKCVIEMEMTTTTKLAESCSDALQGDHKFQCTGY